MKRINEEENKKGWKWRGKGRQRINKETPCIRRQSSNYIRSNKSSILLFIVNCCDSAVYINCYSPCAQLTGWTHRDSKSVSTAQTRIISNCPSSLSHHYNWSITGIEHGRLSLLSSFRDVSPLGYTPFILFYLNIASSNYHGPPFFSPPTYITITNLDFSPVNPRWTNIENSSQHRRQIYISTPTSSVLTNNAAKYALSPPKTNVCFYFFSRTSTLNKLTHTRSLASFALHSTHKLFLPKLSHTTTTENGPSPPSFNTKKAATILSPKQLQTLPGHTHTHD